MKTSYFPHRLFFWFVYKQIVFSGLGLLILSFGFISWFSLNEKPSLIWMVAILFFAAFVLFILISFIMARALVIPLGRLIQKTRRLRLSPFEEQDVFEKPWALDEPGEWYDLERALNKLGQDLRHKTIRLSREKTELRTIMAAMSEAILAIDQNHRPLFLNPQFATLFSLPQVELQSFAIQDFLRSPEILSAYERCLSEGQNVRVECAFNINHTDRNFSVSVAPLRKKHNQEIYGAVGIFYDITELKKAERIRIEFVGNVSHELRTPLTSVKGYLQVLESDLRSGQFSNTAEFLEIIQNNVDRLILLVNDLLDLSSLESGVKLNFSEIDLKQLTEGVLQQLNPREHVIKLFYEVDILYADFLRVEQVLRNLVQNALRYVQKGGWISIRWEKAESKTILRIKDNGPGIPLKHQKRIFERFYRIDEARSREVGGTGIGLSIVKHILSRHKGAVQMTSQENEGAEFVCEFPNLVF